MDSNYNMKHDRLPVTVSSEQPEKDITELIHYVKPDWKDEDLEFTKISGGYSCLMYKCSLKSAPDEAVTIRGSSTLREFPQAKYNRGFELTVLKTLVNEGLFPKILGVFQNGYCYEYIKGRTLTDMTKIPFKMDMEEFRKMAEKLAEIHSVKIDVADKSFATGHKIFDFSHALVEENYIHMEDRIKDPEFLHKNLLAIQNKIESYNFNKVLVHGDPHPGNVLLEDTGRIIFVDWELTNIGYQPSDFGQLFMTSRICKLQCIGCDDYETFFVQSYLKKYYELNPQQPELNQEQIDCFMKAAKLYDMFFCLWFGAMLECKKSIVDEIQNRMKAATTDDPKTEVLDFSNWIQDRYDDFDRMKDELL